MGTDGFSLSFLTVTLVVIVVASRRQPPRDAPSSPGGGRGSHAWHRSWIGCSAGTARRLRSSPSSPSSPRRPSTGCRSSRRQPTILPSCRRRLSAIDHAQLTCRGSVGHRLRTKPIEMSTGKRGELKPQSGMLTKRTARRRPGSRIIDGWRPAVPQPVRPAGSATARCSPSINRSASRTLAWSNAMTATPAGACGGQSSRGSSDSPRDLGGDRRDVMSRPCASNCWRKAASASSLHVSAQTELHLQATSRGRRENRRIGNHPSCPRHPGAIEAGQPRATGRHSGTA